MYFIMRLQPRASREHHLNLTAYSGFVPSLQYCILLMLNPELESWRFGPVKDSVLATLRQLQASLLLLQLPTLTAPTEALWQVLIV